MHLDIDSESRLITKHYVKGDNIIVPIMKFPYICSNIPAAQVYREISLSFSDIPKLVVLIRILNLLEELAMISFPINNSRWPTYSTSLGSSQLPTSIVFV